MIKLDAQDLRNLDEEFLVERGQVYIIIDNVYDTYNIGSIFRLADAIGARKVFTCGLSQIAPDDVKVKRASINTTKVMEYENVKNTIDAISALKESVPYISIIAIEQTSKSFDYRETDYPRPIAFVVGNETHGVSQEVLDACDHHVEIPMLGVNKSLNVHCALAIVGYHSLQEYP